MVLNIGIVQMYAAPLRVDENLSLAEAMIARAVKEGAQLVVLPEMFNVGFYLGRELMTVAEPLEGRTTDWIRSQATRHNIYITGSFYEHFEEHFYNTMFMVGSNGELQYYRKRNPTLTEATVWRRSEEPGPGIFDTPFGRIGGAICFDSFARETFEGFKQSAVDLVIIVALWGTVVPSACHPETMIFRTLMKRWTYLASEVVPSSYPAALGIPTVFVNQAGTTHFPVASPRFWPLPPMGRIAFDFQGSSHVRDASGQILAQAGKAATEFHRVVSLDLGRKGEKPPVMRSDIPPSYRDSSYYFVQPPWMAKMHQAWCHWGYQPEYEARRALHCGQNI